ncbi:MAG: four helix bundle protein [Bacteroidetes bacterium]|nr:four helix bundle protein [Bacteroidota bacterium]
MEKYNDFRDMNVWQQSISMLVKIYEITASYPESEKFGLVSDMRRAANSVSHNIAEGYGRYEPRDKTRFYKISRGSMYELMSQLEGSKLLKYITLEVCDNQIIEYKQIIKELDSLINAVENRGS